jgi:hypothetical protein
VGYEFDQPETLTFLSGYVPSEDVINGLEVKVVFVPLLNVCSLPEWYLNRYKDGIIARAMWDRMRRPGKKWSNPSGAQFYFGEYRDAVNRGKQEIVRSNVNRAVTMRA